jgi:probable F420-dependent oxidoreductase
VKFSFHLPVDKVSSPAEFLTGGAVAEIAREVEAAGFEACFVTDHPAPSTAWVERGGHHALDPFVALAFAAAATTRLRLHTNILVVPYRNPFLLAKSVASLDRLSDGRVILGMGTGYLRPEFDALGAPFERRADAAEASIELMKRIWTGESVYAEGVGFKAEGVSGRPTPLQSPHPPIWSGGNSTRALRRAVALCDGWSPFPVPAGAGGATRTEALGSVEDLAVKLRQLEGFRTEIGRTGPFDICMVPFTLGLRFGVRPEARELIDDLSGLAELGVTWAPISLPCRDREEAIANAQWFSGEIRPQVAGSRQ